MESVARAASGVKLAPATVPKLQVNSPVTSTWLVPWSVPLVMRRVAIVVVPGAEKFTVEPAIRVSPAIW